MRVVHIIKATRISGAERHLLILLPALKARGIDVHLILLEDPAHPVDDMAHTLTEADVPVWRIPIYRHSDLRVIGRIRHVLRTLRPEIVHTHLIHADLYGTLAARLARVRTVISSRHNDDNFRRLLPVRTFHRLLWRMTDSGIAISQAIARFCIEVEGAPAGKITTIYYGLPLQIVDRKQARIALRHELKLPPDTPLVGMVCRLIEQKGVIYGLRAFARVASQFPAAHLVIAGDGVLHNALEREARTLGVADRVHFLGWRSDTPTIMAALDLMLMPSLWEGFGLVMLEAMAQTVPIIGSDVSAIPEVVLDRETGRLVPVRDTGALATALSDLLSDEAGRRHMGLMGQDRVETTFSVVHMVDQTLALYARFAR
jgi:glycosyltransferase involved in cell wall biosynthesis